MMQKRAFMEVYIQFNSAIVSKAAFIAFIDDVNFLAWFLPFWVSVLSTRKDLWSEHTLECHRVLCASGLLTHGVWLTASSSLVLSSNFA